jgi:DNA-directed RNA polymerase specialized sigma24 family protein
MLNISNGQEHNRSGYDAGVIDTNDAEAAASTRANGYAKCEDFRRVFLANLDSLYQLCFLLTGDPDRAEQCLIAGLDECVRSQQVFRDFALPWAKRTLIQIASRALPPRASRAELSRPANGFPHPNLQSGEGQWFNISAVLSLPDFERCVFVLSVLDEYSDRDCAFLLGCVVGDVRNARTRALDELAAIQIADPIPIEQTKISARQAISPFAEY